MEAVLFAFEDVFVSALLPVRPIEIRIGLRSGISVSRVEETEETTL